MCQELIEIGVSAVVIALLIYLIYTKTRAPAATEHLYTSGAGLRSLSEFTGGNQAVLDSQKIKAVVATNTDQTLINSLIQQNAEHFEEFDARSHLARRH